MINAWDNYKYSVMNTKYEFCEIDNTTEHLFECSVLQTLNKEVKKTENLESIHNMQEVKGTARYIQRVNEIRNKITW